MRGLCQNLQIEGHKKGFVHQNHWSQEGVERGRARMGSENESSGTFLGTSRAVECLLHQTEHSRYRFCEFEVHILTI